METVTCSHQSSPRIHSKCQTPQSFKEHVSQLTLLFLLRPCVLFIHLFQLMHQRLKKRRFNILEKQQSVCWIFKSDPSSLSFSCQTTSRGQIRSVRAAATSAHPAPATEAGWCSGASKATRRARANRTQQRLDNVRAIPGREGGCLFTFMTFERSDGGVGLPLQFQQRDLPGEITDEGVLRLVIISARGVRA